MNIQRIWHDIRKAQRQFDYVEGHPTTDGGVMAMVALQTIPRHIYTLEITFPDAYPNAMPEVFVRTPALKHSEHRYSDNRICYMHPRVWNPGRHDLTYVIQRAAKWLNKYEVYLVRGRWPGAGIDH